MIGLVVNFSKFGSCRHESSEHHIILQQKARKNNLDVINLYDPFHMYHSGFIKKPLTALTKSAGTYVILTQPKEGKRTILMAYGHTNKAYEQKQVTPRSIDVVDGCLFRAYIQTT